MSRSNALLDSSHSCGSGGILLCIVRMVSAVTGFLQGMKVTTQVTRRLRIRAGILLLICAICARL